MKTIGVTVTQTQENGTIMQLKMQQFHGQAKHWTQIQHGQQHGIRQQSRTKAVIGMKP